jgi:hypothetical protein
LAHLALTLPSQIQRYDAGNSGVSEKH